MTVKTLNLITFRGESRPCGRSLCRPGSTGTTRPAEIRRSEWTPRSTVRVDLGKSSPSLGL